ncbi:MAG: DsbA family oxidoreductase [Hyphomonadaceae bacterium]|nr:DsbA family oxidoreductase [Hyphomonadaceae bacterium]
MATPLRIDFISDIACPWCVIGLRGLERALAEVGSAVEADIHLLPFELNPQMGPEGENVSEHIQKKYGSTPAQSAAARQALKDRGADLGFTFNYAPDTRIWNTFDAHRLLHWAALEGKQLALKHALFAANFTEQLPVSDHRVLADAAARAGLDPERARQILTSNEYADEVRRDEALWQSRGVRAVPTVIFNQRWMIQGGQPPEVFAQAIHDIVSGTAREAQA